MSNPDSASSRHNGDGDSFADSAATDLEELRNWYFGKGVPEIGARRIDEMIQRIGYLADHPDMGRVVPEFSLASLREPIHSPFRIVYRRDPGLVRIVRI